MKILSKLITTVMLLLIGALVSFGETLSEDEYNDLIRSTNAQELVDKLQTKERFNQFAKMAGEKNPEMAPQIQHYVEDHKGKHLKNLDKGQLQAVFQGAVGFNNELPAANKHTKKESRPTKRLDKSDARKDTRPRKDQKTKTEAKPQSHEKSNVKSETKSKLDKHTKSKPTSKKHSDAKVDKKTKTKAHAADAKKKAKAKKEAKSKSDLKSKKKKDFTSSTKN